MELFNHQKEIIRDNKNQVGIFLGTGCSKTLTALMLAEGNILVVCPKTQAEDQNWQRENKKWSINKNITVISKETFRRDWDKLPHFDTLIIDEAHTALGATPNVMWRNRKPVPKTSQIFEALMAYVRKHRPTRIYPCTATIAKSPMTVWACARLLGRDWNFYEFRDTFYFKLPMPGREVYSVKNDTASKERLAKAVRTLGYTGKLSDFFDVPDQTFKNVFVEMTPLQQKVKDSLQLQYPEPIVLLQKELQIENGIVIGNEFTTTEMYSNEKVDRILEYADEFPRMIIFSRYLGQIGLLEHELKKAGKKVFVMTGDTKDRGEIIKELKTKDEYIFIVSAQISAGWELPDCEVMIFASRTYSIVDLEQSWGRIHRANKLKKNLYINLITKGGVDEAVHDCLENKKDFSERLFLKM